MSALSADSRQVCAVGIPGIHAWEDVNALPNLSKSCLSSHACARGLFVRGVAVELLDQSSSRSKSTT